MVTPHCVIRERGSARLMGDSVRGWVQASFRGPVGRLRSKARFKNSVSRISQRRVRCRERFVRQWSVRRCAQAHENLLHIRNGFELLL